MDKKVTGFIMICIILSIVSILYYESLCESLESSYIGITSMPYDMEGNELYSVEFMDFDGNEIKELQSTEIESPSLPLNALFSALVDGESGRVLYEKQGDKQVPMASTTKIMTCMIALEKGNLEDEVTVSSYASTMPDVQLNIKAGEKYRLRDLLYSLMLESHNDVAVAIAEHIGGTVEDFAVMMNEKAKELGCMNTNFVTPNGLDAEGHYTTAVELARIASYAIKNEEFIKITNTQSYEIKELTKGRSFSLSNRDRFLYMYDGAVGVKTGFTNKAGYCFVGAVKKGGKTLVSSVLGSGWPPNKNYKWKDTLTLMNHGMDKFFTNEVFYEEKEFQPILVYNGKEESMDLYYDGEITTLMAKDEVVKIVYQLPRYLVAPVTSKTVVGTAKYYIGSEFLGEFPILTAKDIEKINYQDVLKQIFKIWMPVKQ